MYGLATYNERCAPSLTGMFGLGAALTREQRLAKAAATKAANLAKRTQRKAAVAAKRAARVAGRTVQTSRPDVAAKLNSQIANAQAQLRNVTSLASRARSTRNKADVQKALAAAQSAAKFITTLNAPVTPSVAAGVNRLRGMGYFGDCVADASGAGYDDQTGQPCDAPGYTPTDINVPGATPQYQQPYQQPGVYPGTTSPYGLTPGALSPTGLVPGFGTGLPSFGGGYAPQGCRAGSNLPRCLIFQMAVDEQQQFQFVFTILQQMYAQLLQIVQQLLVQLQSAQQQPYGYGQQPYGPGQYNDPNNPLYGNQFGYGGQYGGPGGYPGVPYYPGGADSSAIPPGYGDSGGDMFGAGGQAPGDAGAVFPGPGPMQQLPGAQLPGGPNIISSDSLPDGADTSGGGGWGGDDAGNIVPSYTPAPQSLQPIAVQSGQASQSATTGPNTPQIIVLQQGPGQSPYADSALPAGPVQNQPSLEPPTTEEWSN